VSCGICARCKKRKGCRFRQPGTWVQECDLFVAACTGSSGSGTERNGTAQAEGLNAGSQAGVNRQHTSH